MAGSSTVSHHGNAEVETGTDPICFVCLRSQKILRFGNNLQEFIYLK